MSGFGTQIRRRGQRITVLSLMVISLVLPQASGAQEVIDLNQALRDADQIAAFKPKSEFDIIPKGPAYADKSFSFTLPIVRVSSSRNLTDCDPIATWRYDQSEGVLEISMGLSAFTSTEFTNLAGAAQNGLSSSSPVEYLSLSCVGQKLPSVRATNAFGASTTVYRGRRTIVGIGRSAWPDGIYSLSIPVSGNEAQMLIANLKIRLIGKLKNWWGEQSILCGSVSDTATFNHPWETHDKICLYTGVFDQVEIIDIRDGQSIGIIKNIVSGKTFR